MCGQRQPTTGQDIAQHELRQARLVATATTRVAPAAASIAEIAARSIFAGPGFIDRQGASIKLLAVEVGDRLVGFFLRRHFHKGETAGLVCELVHDEFAFDDVARLLEQVEDGALGSVERQIAYE